MTERKENRMDKIINLAKRRGFIFPSSEIYGGLGATYDYGPLGVELKNNIKKAWWQMFVRERADMLGLDAAIIMHPKVWEASGHLKNFSDPLVDCKSCQRRFRADHLLEAWQAKPGYDREKPISWQEIRCPECGGELTEVRQFNLMFKTFMGPVENESATVYLRPETAGGMFVDFKNILEIYRMKIPFGLGQIGKAFRNEITTENFIFRTREFEQMEVEYFIHPKNWRESFEQWLALMKKWCHFLGIKEDHLVYHEIPDNERAFYSKRTIDIEYLYPFGQKELYGLAYRTDYDLSQHQKFSGQDLSYTDPETKEKYLPHVIEPSLGVDRSVLACLLEAYEEVKGGRTTTTEATKEEEIVLHLPKELAPVKVAVLPLSRKEKLTDLAWGISENLRQHWNISYDETASIGRRYRRQDEIGTPYAVTIDFESPEDQAVTVRDRETMKQDRIKIAELISYLKDKLGC